MKIVVKDTKTDVIIRTEEPERGDNLVLAGTHSGTGVVSRYFNVFNDNELKDTLLYSHKEWISNRGIDTGLIYVISEKTDNEGKKRLKIYTTQRFDEFIDAPFYGIFLGTSNEYTMYHTEPGQHNSHILSAHSILHMEQPFYGSTINRKDNTVVKVQSYELVM